MLPYCGQTLRVKDTVDRIIDDKTGRMLKIPKDCLILEGAVCSGERTRGLLVLPAGDLPLLARGVGAPGRRGFGHRPTCD